MNCNNSASFWQFLYFLHSIANGFTIACCPLMLGRILGLCLDLCIYSTIDIPCTCELYMMGLYGLLFIVIIFPYSFIVAVTTYITCSIALISLNPLCNELMITSMLNIVIIPLFCDALATHKFKLHNK